MGFKITLLPENQTFTAKARETILEAAKRHGHNLPQGCNDGASLKVPESNFLKGIA